MKDKKIFNLYIKLCVAIAFLCILGISIILMLSNFKSEPADTTSDGSQTFEEYTSDRLSQSTVDSDKAEQSEQHISSVPSHIDYTSNNQSKISIPTPTEALESVTSSEDKPSTPSYQSSPSIVMPTLPSFEENTEAEQNYKNEIANLIKEYEQQIDYWRNKASEYYGEKERKKQVLAEQVAEMGMTTGSGYYKRKIEELENEYKTKQAECQEKIDYYREKIEELKSRIN